MEWPIFETIYCMTWLGGILCFMGLVLYFFFTDKWATRRDKIEYLILIAICAGGLMAIGVYVAAAVMWQILG